MVSGNANGSEIVNVNGNTNRTGHCHHTVTCNKKNNYIYVVKWQYQSNDNGNGKMTVCRNSNGTHKHVVA